MALRTSAFPSDAIMHEDSKYNIAVGTTALTMSIWVNQIYRNATYNCSFQINVGTVGNRSYRARMSCRYDASAYYSRVRDADGSYWGIVNTYTTRDMYQPYNKWQHACVVWDLTANTCTWYCDGVLIYQAAMGCPYSTYDTSLPNNITFFGRKATGSAFADPFYGSMEDARIYDRALAQSEIRELFSKRGTDNILDYKFRAYMVNKASGASAATSDLKYTGSERPVATSVPANLVFTSGVNQLSRRCL